ncbi:MAG: hypothetical protein ACLU38_01715 [Dysosmobacter sp.]
MECPKCGESALEVQTDGVRFRLWVPCGLCGGVHQAECSAQELLEGREHRSGLLGDEAAVYATPEREPGDGPDEESWPSGWTRNAQAAGRHSPTTSCHRPARCCRGLKDLWPARAG